MTNTDTLDNSIDIILTESGLLYKIGSNYDGDHYYPEEVKDRDFNDRVEKAKAAIKQLVLEARVDEWGLIHETLHSSTLVAQQHVDEVMDARIAELSKEET